jgi:hypothetical protein
MRLFPEGVVQIMLESGPLEIAEKSSAFACAKDVSEEVVPIAAISAQNRQGRRD